MTHISMKVRPNLGRAGFKAGGGTTQKKKPPTTPEGEEVIDDDKDAEEDEDDDDALDYDNASYDDERRLRQCRC